MNEKSPFNLPPAYGLQSRPGDCVTVEEWRILISSLAGSLRLSQGSTKRIRVPANTPKCVSTNDKSYSLFVRIQTVVGAPVLYAMSRDGSVNLSTGIPFTSGVDQILLPGERLYIITAAANAVVAVTEATV